MYQCVWDSSTKLNSITDDNEEWEHVKNDDDDNNNVDEDEEDNDIQSKHDEENAINKSKQNSVIVVKHGPLVNHSGMTKSKGQTSKPSGSS